MNILVIGNGFDLAHGLDTKYKDFLEIINLYENMRYIDRDTQFDVYMKNISGKKIQVKLKQYVTDQIAGGGIKDETKIFLDVKKKNFWLLYFNMLLDDELKNKDGWIDFETEIKNVVKKISSTIDEFGMNILDNNIASIGDSTIINAINTKGIRRVKSYQEIIDFLEKDLQVMIQCLEVYLEKYVNYFLRERMINVISKDIIDDKIDKVLSFNYTKTFEILYDLDQTVEYDYIHGKANLEEAKENNMVLGIDEYLPDDKKNEDVKFIAFKKFYQRIYKETGSKYREWQENIANENKKYIGKIEFYRNKLKLDAGGDEKRKSWEKELKNLIDNPPEHNLYIFGHSLDITDKDILKELFISRNMHIVIYYHDKETLGRQITNLVKIIGQDELIRRTGGNKKDIEFRKQQVMVNMTIL